MLNIHQLEQQIQEQMQAARVPGLALAIVHGQQVVYARGFGVTSVEDGGIPVTPQTLFRVGSVTKPLTGTAVMRLVEAGALDLDCPVKTYVPWLTFSQEGVVDRITLRLLMSHTAGLPTDVGESGSRDPEGLEAYIRARMHQYPLILPPGKLWSYSNVGLCLVGYVAEVAAGKPYATLMQELVFDPLEMRRTTFDPTVAMTYPLAQAHELDQASGSLRVLHRFADNVGHYPAGFAITTVLDLAQFAIMQMSGGRLRDRQILAPESVAEMQRQQVDMYSLNSTGYGLTFGSHIHKGIRRAGHGGGISSFGASFQMAPDHQAAVILVHNRITDQFPVGKIVDGIFDQVLGLPEEVPAPKPVEPDRSIWPRLAGTYVGEWSGQVKVDAAEGQLILEWNDQRLPLQALRNDLYFAERPEQGPIAVGFLLEQEGPASYLVLNSAPCKRSVAETRVELAPDLLAAYAGTYTSHVDEVTVRVEEGRLVIRSKRQGVEAPLSALEPDCFSCPYGMIEFQRAANGSVASLRLGRVLTFTRASEETGAGDSPS